MAKKAKHKLPPANSFEARLRYLETRRDRERRSLLAAGLLLTMLILVTLAILGGPTDSERHIANSPRSNTAIGGKALYRVLKKEGIETSYIKSIQSAVKEAGPETTVAIFTSYASGIQLGLSDSQVTELKNSGANIVIVTGESTHVAALSDNIQITYEHDDYDWGIKTANCSNEDAVAAVRLQGSVMLMPTSESVSGAEFCFKEPVTANGNVAPAIMAVEKLPSGGTLTVFSESDLFQNQNILEEGAAAIALRSLGAKENLVWTMVPDYGNYSGNDSFVSEEELLPKWLKSTFGFATIVFLVIALWKVKRFGPLLPERLPVVVRAHETTYGRGRLYHQSAARGRSAALLRAHSAKNIADRLSISSQAEPAELVDAIVHLCPHRNRSEIQQLLYGPSPRNNTELMELANQLEKLESEARVR